MNENENPNVPNEQPQPQQPQQQPQQQYYQPQPQPQQYYQPQPQPVPPAPLPIAQTPVIGLIFGIVALSLAVLSFPIALAQFSKFDVNLFEVLFHVKDYAMLVKDTILTAGLIFLIFGIAAIVFSSIAKSKAKAPYGYALDGKGRAGRICANIALPFAIMALVDGFLFLIVFFIANSVADKLF